MGKVAAFGLLGVAACGRIGFGGASSSDSDVTIDTATSSDAIAPTAGLVGWWRFDEIGGFTAVDSSGRGNDAVVAGSPSASRTPARSRSSSTASAVDAGTSSSTFRAGDPRGGDRGF